MKMIDDVIIIGIDSGYGNIKTANCCFPASVSTYAKEPVFKENLLVFESKFYLIGEGHKEFLADKTKDLDYYVLALAAIARELNIRKMTCGKIRIAAGLPLTWVSGQRDEFRDYLMQNKAVDFENEFSAQFFNSAWRQFRKRNAYPTAITQNVEYLLDSVQASTMLSNSEFVVMLNQAASDRGQLAKLLNISNEQMSYITNADAGCGLIKYGSALVPFINRFPQDTKLYQLMTTRPGEGKFARGRD